MNTLKVPSNTPSTYADVNTGELLTLAPVIDNENKPKYLYVGGYVTMGLTLISRLRSTKLPVDGYRLALLIAERVAPVSNLCHGTNVEFGRELGISDRARVSKLLKRLVDEKLIVKLGPHLVMVNPSWCFRGTPEQHHNAQQTWCQLNPIGLVPPREGDGQTAA